MRPIVFAMSFFDALALLRILLHDLACVSWVGCVLYRSRITYDVGRLESSYMI